MKKAILCILLLLSLMFTACGNISEKAQPEKENTQGREPVAKDFSWIITNGTLTIKGNGAMPDFGYDLENPWESQKESITKVVISEGITHIGNEAFYHCANLSQIHIPNSVTSIGASALEDCVSLKSITFSGTKAQWESIEKDDYSNHSFTVICTDGNI